MQNIAVIDYGMGNLRSVVNALEHVAGKNHKVVLTSDPDQVMRAQRVVFPGQGAAGDCMRAIDQYELRETVCEAAANKPFLGICMGMQVLIEHSEENQGTDCLGIYPGRVRYFGDHHHDDKDEKLKVPHMGWNQLHQTGAHPLWGSIDDDARFYFVHSYYVESTDNDQVFGLCEYGNRFTAAAGKDNLFAVQFHPEKSQQAGLKLLENFLNWNGAV